MLKRSTIEEWELVLAYIESCRDVEEVMSIMHNRMNYLGFEKSAYWLRWSNNEDDSPILLTTYPEKYVEHYIENDFAAHDMVGTLSANSNRPFDWREIEQRYPITKKQRVIFQDCSSIGLKEGASVPIHGPNIMKATFSVASDIPEKEFQELFKFHRHEIHILAVAAHEKMIELGLGHKAEIKPLTNRESEVLVWIARGETYAEIADRLCIQEDTIKKHMQHIFYKLDASNGTHAAITAFKHGVINP